jgi:D-glycero-alpha-D-manno-heptose-7-phosphate kinase
LCGAGGGGFLLVYAPPAAHSSVRSALKDFRELPFAFERYGSRVIFNVHK